MADILIGLSTLENPATFAEFNHIANGTSYPFLTPFTVMHVQGDTCFPMVYYTSCDADPDALADYVLALLKHDAAEPDLRKMFISQLEEFLEGEASKFVDTLFAALRSKSYLPYEPVKSESHQIGIPIPLDGLVSERGRKRGLEIDEHNHPPPKGPRLSNDTPFSRFSPTGRRNLPPNGRGGSRGEGSSNLYSQNNREDDETYRTQAGLLGRGRKDNGFCARGSLCQYSHGDDAVVPPMSFASLMQGNPPFIPMYSGSNSFMSNAPYDPHESRMEMGSRGRGSRLNDAPPISSTELPVIQDLTPQDPIEEATRGEHVIQPNGFTHNFGTPRRIHQQQHMHNIVPPALPSMFPEEIAHMYMGLSIPPMNNNPQLPNQNMLAGTPFKRNVKGTFTPEAHSLRNAPRDDKTLVVEKIPDDRLSLEAVNDWFKRFGVVTNVAIDPSGSKALVSFSSHAEAVAAWKSEEAIFGNRFVKVFWHRPVEGQGAVGQRALVASAPLLKNLSSSQSEPPESSKAAKTPASKVPAAALVARQRALEQQISQQKVLISRLKTAKTPEERQEIMTSLKKLQRESLPSSPSVSPADSSQNGVSKSKFSSEEDKLDQELDLHKQELSGEQTKKEESQETAALREKLASLKAEAMRIGVPNVEINSDSQSTSTSYRPYRGRRGFRARGGIRGGRGLARGSMKLDNRPRRLLIQIPPNDEAVQAVRAYYQNLGNLESFWKLEDGQVVAQFWSRAAAESALASASDIDIPSVGKAKITWHTGPVPFTPVPTPTSFSQSVDPDTKMKDDQIGPESDHKDGGTARDLEESGWGQSFDDEGESRRRRSRSRSFS
ncbi:hypothetical protein Clacol_003646 [Clathrus columnatus]|uniref:RRM domain-containing protein n=1 Tax=Clathrus columnatus TaxID=1419009 RepID=A0AAV5A849_9AGAM|nr:hypothetical protein Clacol_003646 [Clathrus columnatus]